MTGNENPPITAYFLPNDPGMTNFCHSNVIPSFEDEDEWDEVDQFPYRETRTDSKDKTTFRRKGIIKCHIMISGS